MADTVFQTKLLKGELKQIADVSRATLELAVSEQVGHA